MCLTYVMTHLTSALRHLICYPFVLRILGHVQGSGRSER